MGRAAILLATFGALVGAAAWAFARRQDIADQGLAEAVAADAAGVADMVMELPGFNLIRMSNMRAVDQGLVDHPNVQAMLRVIRQGESSQSDAAYYMLVGGGRFMDMSDHPRIYKQIRGARTSAAGAYQITATTWDDTAPAMGLPDFSPRSQDIAALGRIAYRGALNDVLMGRLDQAIAKLRKEWTSLPGAAEQNRLQSMGISHEIFLAYGGQIQEETQA
jgi:lysozyme